MSNDALIKHISELNNAKVCVGSHNDMERILESIKHYSKTNSYSFKQPFVVFSLFIGTILVAMSLMVKELIGLLPVGALLALISAGFYFNKRSKISSVGSDIFHQCVGLSVGVLKEYEFNGRELWKELIKDFPLFSQGDESQKITELYKGETPNGIEFELFEFQYVNVEDIEEEDSDGKKTTRTERTTHYVYGAITYSNLLTQISINASRFKIKWTAASKGFNKSFNVRAESEIAAAKFFTPSNVLRFEDNFKHIYSIDTLPSGKSVISTTSKILPSSIKAPKISKTEEYLTKAKQKYELPKLQALIELIDLINK